MINISDIVDRDPIFYSPDGQSRSGQWQSLNDEALDIAAMKEYLLSGFVSGARTLFPNIRKSQAGEVLKFTPDGVQKENWFEYRYSQHWFNDYNPWEEAQAFLELLDAAIESALSSIGPGQKLIVPLSGGHDSRLLISRIAASGFKDVVCFSYGSADNEQSRISKRIADAFGYRWFFIEHTAEKWQDLHDAGLIETYALYACQGSSIPHLQDFLAIHELMHKGVIAAGDLCMPGHTLDFLAGGHINQSDLSCNDAEAAVRRVVRRHFAGLRHDAMSERPLVRRIHENFQGFAGPPSQFQEWFNWRNRQTKFIVNSCATYRFFDMQVALPFWDPAVVRYWLTLPPKIKAGRQFYFAMEPFLLDGRLDGIPFAGESKAVGIHQRAEMALRDLMPPGLASRLVSAFGVRRRTNEALNLTFCGLGDDIQSAFPQLAKHPIASWPPLKSVLCRRPYQLESHRVAAIYTLNLLLARQ